MNEESEIFIGSHDEWSPLQEVIVGSAKHARVPFRDIGQSRIEFGDTLCTPPSPGPIPGYVIDETEEDLAELVRILEDVGVSVRRPRPLDHSKLLGAYEWSSDGFNSYCPRDSLLVVGSRIIETPMALRCRHLEQFAYREILLDYFEQGAQWFSAPKPQLLDDTYHLPDINMRVLANREPIFDAANVLRAGRDLFYQISNTGNELGCRWLSRMLGRDYRVHPCPGLYGGAHIDSTISLLRPGLVLLNPERVTKENLPQPLRQWDAIWCPPPVDIGYSGPHPYSSVWVGMNLLMISPCVAIIDARQRDLMALLKRHGIDTIPVNLRHARTLGGGLHCVVLDTMRRGDPARYF